MLFLEQCDNDMHLEDLIHFNVCLCVCVCVYACLITDAIGKNPVPLSGTQKHLITLLLLLFWQTSHLTINILLIHVCNLCKFESYWKAFQFHLICPAHCYLGSLKLEYSQSQILGTGEWQRRQGDVANNFMSFTTVGGSGSSIAQWPNSPPRPEIWSNR